jgi:type I restriction enzyme, S subunit
VDAKHFNPRLLAVFWNSRPVRVHIERRAKTTAGIHKINQADLESTPLPLPPRVEQDRLLAELDRCLSIGDKALLTVDDAMTQCARLRQSVLQWAFEGRLADQDPNDEPASVLLERIRTEAAARARSASPELPPKRRGRKGTMRGSKSRN